MRRALWMALAAGLGLIAASMPARADMAGLPWPCASGTIERQRTFPPGTLDPLGRPQRPVPYCAITTCASDADCDSGTVCSQQEVGLCVEGPRPTATPLIRIMNCEPDGGCPAEGAVCERARRCVSPGALEASPAPARSESTEPTPPEPSPRRSSGLCAVGHGPASCAMAWPLVLLAFVWRRR